MNSVLENAKAGRRECFLRSIADLAFDRYTNGSASKQIEMGKLIELK